VIGVVIREVIVIKLLITVSPLQSTENNVFPDEILLILKLLQIGATIRA